MNISVPLMLGLDLARCSVLLATLKAVAGLIDDSAKSSARKFVAILDWVIKKGEKELELADFLDKKDNGVEEEYAQFFKSLCSPQYTREELWQLASLRGSLCALEREDLSEEEARGLLNALLACKINKDKHQVKIFVH